MRILERELLDGNPPLGKAGKGGFHSPEPKVNEKKVLSLYFIERNGLS